MAKRSVTVRIKGLHDPDDDVGIRQLTPGERIALVWRLTVDTWAFMGELIGESRLSRDVAAVSGAGVEYLLVGAHALAVHGHPRGIYARGRQGSVGPKLLCPYV